MNKIPTEYQECVVFAQWLDAHKLKYSHLAQETSMKNWGALMRRKKMGVKSGVPDYLIIIPNGLAFIEMKRLKGGKTSLAQNSWIEALNLIPNVEAKICKGVDEAINYLQTLCQ